MFTSKNIELRHRCNKMASYILLIFFLICNFFMFSAEAKAEDSFNGSLISSYPIDVPPGKGGLAPNINLTYSSSQHDGWLGVGWDLNLGYIERDTKLGKPSYNDTDDFVINMPGATSELIKEGLEYRLKQERAFLKIIKNTSDWVVKDKNGTIYRFGSVPLSNSILNVPGTSSTFRWYLDSIEDPNGNEISITYNLDAANNQLYPSQIDYNENNHIVFCLENKPDAAPMYNNYFMSKTAKRLISIVVYNGGTTVATSDVVRAYKLSYGASASTSRSILQSIQVYGDDAVVNGNGIVTGGTSLPAMTMAWPVGEKGVYDHTTWLPLIFNGNFYTTSDGPDYWNNQYGADFNGDGRTDYMYYKEYNQYNNTYGWWVALSKETGDGFYQPTRWLDGIVGDGTGNATISEEAKHKFVSDFNGDGRADYMWYRGTNWYVVFANNAGNGFDGPYDCVACGEKNANNTDSYYVGDFNGDGRNEFIWLDTAGTPVIKIVSLADQNHNFNPTVIVSTSNLPQNPARKFISDFNGDGKSDVLTYDGSNNLVVYLANEAGNGFTSSIWLEDDAGPGGVTINPDKSQTVSDFNGDGKTDFMYYYDGTVTDYKGWLVALSNGAGFETPTRWISYNASPEIGVGMVKAGNLIHTGDMNGDGKNDIALMYMYDANGIVIPSSDQGYYIALSKKEGNGFLAPELWVTGVPYYTTRTFFNDYNGDGKTDVMWRQIDWYVSLNKTPGPDQITKITSPTGAVTDITYEPSSLYTNGYLPYVMNLVKTITVSNNTGNTATKTFDYLGGEFDPVNKEFRGFESVTVTDSATGLTTTAEYLQDSVFKNCILYSETMDSAGKLVSSTTNGWEAHVLVNDAVNTTLTNLDDESQLNSHSNSRLFIYPKECTSTSYDKNGYEVADVTVTYEYDAFGNQLSEGIVTSDNISKFTRTAYDNDTANWLLGRPNTIRMAETDPGTSGPPALREIKYEYNTSRPWLLYKKKLIHYDEYAVYNEYVTEYDYDAAGNMTMEKDPELKVTRIEYDSTGMFPKYIIKGYGSPEEQRVYKTYNAGLGVVKTESIPYKGTGDPISGYPYTNYNYDSLGRLSSVNYPDGSYQTYTRVINANESSVTMQGSAVPAKTVWYDQFGRQVKEQIENEGYDIFAHTVYDNAGRVTQKSLPYFYGGNIDWTIYAYHPQRGYLINQQNPDNTHIGIDQSGLTETVTDEKLRNKIVEKDSLGRIKSVTEPSGGGTAYYTYDIFDNLTQIKDAHNKITTIGYDDLGRKILLDDPYMGIWEYEYYKNGALHIQTDSQNRVTTITYDALNRKKTETGEYYDSVNQYITVLVNYDYDETGIDSYNVGYLTTVTRTETGKPQSKIVCNYDEMGRNTVVIKTIDGVSYTTNIGYDLAGRMNFLKYPDSDRTEYQYLYDSLGNLQQVNEVDGVYLIDVLADFDGYNALGQMGYTGYANGTGTDYQYYDDNYRLQHLTTTNGSGIIQKLDYTFDNVGNVNTLISYTKPLTTGSAYTVNYVFAYDNLDRLTNATASCSNDSSRGYSQAYQYDEVGNMISKTGKGGWEVLSWDSSYQPKKPASVRFDFESEGIGSRNITYNHDNKPVQISYKGGTPTYLTYDGVGNRIKKVQGSSTTIYVGDIFEKRGALEVSHIYAHGKRIITRTSDGKEYYTHTDHLGSTNLVTDETGQVLEENGYLPFGGKLFRNEYNGSTFKSTYRYTGQELDSEYELYNYNARLYDPVLSRFISADSIIPNLYNPQSLNRYSYCLNNPLKYTDPGGRQEITLPPVTVRGEAIPPSAGLGIPGLSVLWGAALDDFLRGLMGFSNINLFGLLAGAQAAEAQDDDESRDIEKQPTLEDLNKLIKEFKDAKYFKWGKWRSGGCDARAGLMLLKLKEAGFDVKYIWTRESKWISRNRFNNHVAVQVTIDDNDYIVDPAFELGKIGPLSVDLWANYLGNPGYTYLQDINPLQLAGYYSPDRKVTKDLEKTYMGNFRYENEEDFYINFLRRLRQWSY